MDLINTFKRPSELRIRFQLSTKVPTKVTAFDWPLDERFLKLKLKFNMMSDEHFIK
jgi:hypothetical protein